MSTDRLLAKFVSQAEPFEGSDYDTIDLTPAQGRKGAGMAWAELGEPILDADWGNEIDTLESEEDNWETEDGPLDIDTSESEPDPQPEETEPSLGENLIGRDLHELLDLSYVHDNETYYWDGHSKAIVGSGNLTLALDGPESNYLIAFEPRPMDEFDAALVSTFVFDRTTGERIVTSGVAFLSFSDGTKVAIPEGEKLAGLLGVRAVVNGEFATIHDSFADVLVSFEQHGEIVSLPIFAADIGTGRVHDYAAVATVRGTDGSDHLTDTAGNDTVVGGAGNDVLRATSHDKYGYDFLYGGAGNDRFIFGSGHANGIGGQGDDIFYAGTGGFTAAGQQGHDKLVLHENPADLIFSYQAGYGYASYGILGNEGRSVGFMATIDEVVFGDKVWRVSEDDHADIGGFYRLVETASGLKLSLMAAFEDAQGNPTQLLGTSDGDYFVLGSSNDADALNAAYGLTGDDSMDATGYLGPSVFFDGSRGHDTLLVSGRPEDYVAEQTVRDRVVHDNGKIEWASHELILTRTGADGTLQKVQAANIEQIIFSDGTAWERADDSAELFPLA